MVECLATWLFRKSPDLGVEASQQRVLLFLYGYSYLQQGLLLSCVTQRPKTRKSKLDLEDKHVLHMSISAQYSGVKALRHMSPHPCAVLGAA